MKVQINSPARCVNTIWAGPDRYRGAAMNESTCTGPECTRPRMVRSEFCPAHRRQERIGNELKPLRPQGLTSQQRFWSKVNKNGSLPSANPTLGPCWEWTDYTDEKGYGRILISRKTRIPHRVSWEWANGPIPDGMVIDHICQNPKCVRPKHLRCATNRQNVEYRKGGNRNNRSGYRGVSWCSRDNNWRAAVQSAGKTYSLGSFADPHEAHLAVVAKRRELHYWDAPDNRAA